MRRSSFVFAMVAAGAVTLAACGGGDGDTATTSSLAGTTEPTDVPTSSAAPTTPTTAAPVSSAPAPSSTTATTLDTSASTAPASAPGGGDADCLNGSWLADAAEHQRRIDALGIPFAMTVAPGSQSTVVIADGTFDADSQVTIGAELPGTGVTLSSTGTSSIQGTFTLDGDVVRATVTSDSTSPVVWSASLNGEEIPLPDSGFADPPDTSFRFDGSTYTCDDTTLSFEVVGTTYGITYTRQG